MMAARSKRSALAAATRTRESAARAAGSGARRKAGTAAARPAAKAAAKPKPPSKAASRGVAGDWRRDTLQRMRELVLAADPAIVEERKWAKASNPLGVPVWSRAGIVCTGETYKSAVKLTFARGASLPDPARLFNASLQGGTRRAIDIHEGESVDASAFQALVRAAVKKNVEAGKKR
jgi:hypothetical protein